MIDLECFFFYNDDDAVKLTISRKSGEDRVRVIVNNVDESGRQERFFINISGLRAVLRFHHKACKSWTATTGNFEWDLNDEYSHWKDNESCLDDVASIFGALYESDMLTTL